jgi:hypothetical protein
MRSARNIIVKMTAETAPTAMKNPVSTLMADSVPRSLSARMPAPAPFVAKSESHVH